MHGRVFTIAALVLFPLVASAIGLDLGLGHDEGVTIQLAVGERDPELMRRFEPWPVTETYEALDGRRAPPAWRVVKNLALPSNPQPPAYFVALNAWVRAFGSGTWTLRLPGLLCGLAALLALARLARRLVPGEAAAGTVLLAFALSPWFGALATFARPYAPALALGLWSTVAALACADAPRRWPPRLAFTALSVLGLYTLYHYAFVLAWQLLFLALASWRDREHRAVGLAHLAGTSVAITAAFAPWIPALVGHLQLTGSVRSYYKAPVTADVASQLERVLAEFLLGVAPVGILRTVLGTAWVALAAVTLLLWIRPARGAHAGDPAGDPVGRLLLVSALAYPGLILAADLAHGTRTLMISKTVFLAVPLLLLVGGRIWARRGGPHLARAAAVVLLALMATASAVTVHMNHAVFEDDHRLIAEHLAPRDEPGHLVLLNTPHRGNAVPLLLTFQDHGIARLQIVMATPQHLDAVVAASCARAGTDRVTLLNLQAGAVYNEKKVWTGEQLDAAARHGRQSGWEVVRAPPRDLAALPPQADGERRMLIVSPVR